jgi:hypothetical protein
MTLQTQIDREFLDELWSDLVVAMLSVNNYPLEKAYVHVQGLKSAGLCSPENLSRLGEDDVVKRLEEAGCNRGAFMTRLFARRLWSLGAAVSTIGIARFTRIIAGNQRTEISNLLLPIYGIGPKVLENFFLLRRID